MRPTKILMTLLVAVLMVWGLEAAVAAQEVNRGWNNPIPPAGWPGNYLVIMDPSQVGWVKMGK